MDAAFKSFFLVCISVLAVLTFFCLVRTIKGPRLVDRIVGTNMIGTMTIAIIALLAAYLNESSVNKFIHKTGDLKRERKNNRTD